jgi:hypothetical protein
MRPSWRVVGTAVGLLVIGGTGFDLLRGAARRPARPSATSDDRAVALRETTPEFGLGALAPDFTLPDRSGKMHHLASMVRGDTLLWFTCGCSNCIDLQGYLATLLHAMPGARPQVITVTTMPPEREDTYFRDTGLHQTLLYESKGGSLMTRYRGHPCPRIYRLASDRRITWISPSPRVVPYIDVIGHQLAEKLGFQEPGGNDPNRPYAPIGPKRDSKK